MMDERQQWNAMSKAQKIAYLQRYPVDVRMELLDVLTFPETGREVREFVDSMFEWEEKRRGPEARAMKLFRSVK